MADNNPNNGQDNPFDHPIRKNNWWLYILGGLCFAGLIIWFFIDWSYKDRNKPEEPAVMEQSAPEEVTPQDIAVESNDTITIETAEPAE